jgi:hypothetical protein
VVEVLRAHTIAPLKVAALFDEHLPVLSKEQEVFVAELMAKEPPLSLDEFEDLIQNLDGQSEAIRLKCADVVCTGIYRCEQSTGDVPRPNLVICRCFPQ